MFSTYSNKKDYILLLKADEFLRDRAINAATRQFDGMVCGMSINPPVNRIRVFDEILCGDPHRPDLALQAVKEFEIMTGLKPRAVIPITEMTLMSAEVIAAEYAIPFLSPETVAASRNKILMKEAFEKGRVPTAKYMPFSTLEELNIAVKELGLPIIVKPIEAAHSIGVKKITTEDEVESSFNRCLNDLKSISEQWGISEGKFQAEEYIDSEHEISVEIVNANGQHKIIAITDKYLTKPPFFAEVGHKVPSRESENVLVRDAAIKACESLNLTHGVSHVEIRIDGEGKPYVIEVASRPGGDGIMDLVERAYGVNLYDLHIRSYLGTFNIRELSKLELLGTAAIAFMPTKKGSITSVNVPDKFPREVKSIYLNYKEGDKIGDSMNYDDRLGTIEYFWRDKTPDENLHLKMAEELRDQIYSISE